MIVIVAIAIYIYVPQLLIKRAAKQVIRRFRQKQAYDLVSARSLEELGLQPRSFLNSLGRPRDWKPKALNLLLQVGVIQSADDGRLFLSEETLSRTKLADKR
ncbi:MAG: hypothetical protein HYX96_09360 [Chloroflexi bacterium]|nr:hypothetical protein [Chloroflexota bacterium]